ncbi:hypothetical protein M0657_003169 [Pyricularia oryzae]|nr:hypothetical protein M0657_003169 [Pyricularia oryzae]KAI7928244.1 hypothetical protein M9X92_001932 [Pyricularia oryzae]
MLGLLAPAGGSEEATETDSHFGVFDGTTSGDCPSYLPPDGRRLAQDDGHHSETERGQRGSKAGSQHRELRGLGDPGPTRSGHRRRS